MKIKFILRENYGKKIKLPANPYGMSVINNLRLHRTKKYQPIQYGWLYPDGSGLDLHNTTLHYHGDIMRFVNSDYNRDELETQGVIDFGKLTGAVRVVYSNAFEIFTKLSVEQLAYIRRNCRGETLDIVVTGETSRVKAFTVHSQSEGYWLQDLNQKLIEFDLVDFNPLLQESREKNWLRHNMDIINKFAERSIAYEIFKENFERLGKPINNFFDIIKQTFKTTHGNKKQEFYNILVTNKIKKTLGVGNWGITFLLENDMVLKIGFSRSGPDINEVDDLRKFSGKYPKELLDFKKLQHLLFSQKASLEDLMIYDYGNINNLTYYVLESKVYPFENKRINSTIINGINSFFYQFNNFVNKKNIPPKSYSKKDMWNSFLEYLEQDEGDLLSSKVLALYDNQPKLYNKIFNHLYDRMRTRGKRVLEDLDAGNLGSLKPLEKDEDLLDDNNPWVQFDF